MLNWNWSYILSTSMLALAITSSLANPSAQAQKRDRSEANSPSTSSPSTSLKVGETRSQAMIRTKVDAIATIYVHKLNDKNAATVYVRRIPVITYVESEELIKSTSDKAQIDKGEIKGEIKGEANKDSSEYLLTSSNPIERATATAATINQINHDGLDAQTIIPAWYQDRYAIKFGDRAILKFDQQTIVPDSQQNQSQDVLETANLLRRLLGGASPLSEILNAPKDSQRFATNSPASPALNNQIVGVMSGMASWYGPGFEGNYSASGELFNTNDLTAAHPSLPFGTLVRIVNLDNGQSVVVRINDRGPHVDGRVIDMSRAAANMIGLITSGVAFVRIEILAK